MRDLYGLWVIRFVEGSCERGGVFGVMGSSTWMEMRDENVDGALRARVSST